MFISARLIATRTDAAKKAARYVFNTHDTTLVIHPTCCASLRFSPTNNAAMYTNTSLNIPYNLRKGTHGGMPLFFNTPGNRDKMNLHYGVSRPTPALGHCPVDILLRHLDRAALAVDAVLCVDNLRVGG